MKIEKIQDKQFYLVDNTIQSVWPPTQWGFWSKMVPEHKLGTALILGLGAGTVAKLLLEKNPEIKITGVDNEPEMISLAGKNLDSSNVTYVLEDAFEFVKRSEEKFDYICVDLYQGGLFPVRCLQYEFATKLREMLTKGGVLVYNLPDLEKLIKKHLEGGYKRVEHEASLLLFAK